MTQILQANLQYHTYQFFNDHIFSANAVFLVLIGYSSKRRNLPQSSIQYTNYILKNNEIITLSGNVLFLPTALHIMEPCFARLNLKVAALEKLNVKGKVFAELYGLKQGVRSKNGVLCIAIICSLQKRTVTKKRGGRGMKIYERLSLNDN